MISDTFPTVGKASPLTTIHTPGNATPASTDSKTTNTLHSSTTAPCDCPLCQNPPLRPTRPPSPQPKSTGHYFSSGSLTAMPPVPSTSANTNPSYLCMAHQYTSWLILMPPQLPTTPPYLCHYTGKWASKLALIRT